MNGAGPIKVQTAMNHSGGVLCLNLRSEIRKPTNVSFKAIDSLSGALIFRGTPNQLGWTVRLQVPLHAGAYHIQLEITTAGKISSLYVCKPLHS
jgi:hypothetical protein